MIQLRAITTWGDGISRRRFLYAAGATGVVAAAGMAWPGAVPALSAAESKWKKADRSKLLDFPTLTMRERDRRWTIARRIMQETQVECLLIPGGGGGAGADNFFTNDASATVVFPMKGEPVVLAGEASFQAASWLENEERGEVSWIKDWRFDHTSPAEVLGDLGLSSARIGTLGVTKGAHNFPAGHTSYRAWTGLQKALPKATLVELWDAFTPEWLAKGEEDLACFRKAALLAEVAAEEVLEITRPGVTEDVLYATVMCAILKHGGGIGGLILHSGPDNASWGPPKWAVRGQRPRTIQNGDVINVEYGASYGHLSSQAQVCMGVGKVSDLNMKLGRTAREQYETALKVLKPGARFGDAAQAINAANRREGFWHTTPQIHSLNPLDPVGPVTEGISQHSSALRERFPHMLERPGTGLDIVLREGMTFQVETNSHSGRGRVNIGGNVVITKTGCEPLNEAPVDFRIVP